MTAPQRGVSGAKVTSRPYGKKSMKDFTMIRKWISCNIALLASLAMAQGAMALSSATSGKMVIDTRVNKEKVVVTFGRYWPS